MQKIIHATVHHVSRRLKDSFIPHEGNNHRPVAISHRALLCYSVILILVKVITLVATIALPSSTLYSSSITSQNIIELTNATRRNLNLDKLLVSSKLSQAAQAKADDMMQAQYFSHTTPSGLTPWEWFKKVGYQYKYAGENLAVHYNQAEDVEEGWLASPSHRANIVNPHYTEIGVGVSTGLFEGAQSYIVVQLFGQPLSSLTSVSLLPVSKNKVTRSTVKQPLEVGEDIADIELSPGKVAAAESLPIATETVASPLISSPVVIDSSLSVKQRSREYEMSIAVRDAVKVSAQFAGQLVSLARLGETNVWVGNLPYDPAVIDRSGEQISIVAWGAAGSMVNQPIAWVAPHVATPQLFNFVDSTGKQLKLLGFTINNLDDSAKRFYLYFAVFLVTAVLLNTFIKIRIQHPTIIGHAAGVLALAIILFLV